MKSCRPQGRSRTSRYRSWLQNGGKRVTHLLIVDSNPVFTAPAEWEFSAALKNVPFSVALARNVDETAGATRWFVPRVHDWETWSDALAHDGTATILQPQALPLYGGVSAHGLLGMYLIDAPISVEEAVKATLASTFQGRF